LSLYDFAENMRALTYQDNDTQRDIRASLIAHAKLNGEQIWFLVEHPTEVGYFGWVMRSEVTYNHQ
jgi:hypothetical protein